MQHISIYDFDKTITRRATFLPFLFFGLRHYRPWRSVTLPLLLLATLGFGVRAIDRGRLKELAFRLVYGHFVDEMALRENAQGFAERTWATNMLPGALDQIAKDRIEGRQIILATASYDFYVRELAQHLGVADVIATTATRKENRISGKIAGENCYGLQKRERIEEWFAQQGIDRADCHIRFYSDHISDHPSLDWSDEAIAANPHMPLRKLAAERGWAVLDWQ